MTMKTILTALAAVSALALSTVTAVAPAQAQYRQKISNDQSKCASGAGPAVQVTINGISQSAGTLRVQSYRGTAADWLEKGRWLNRIEDRLTTHGSWSPGLARKAQAASAPQAQQPA